MPTSTVMVLGILLALWCCCKGLKSCRRNWKKRNDDKMGPYLGQHETKLGEGGKNVTVQAREEEQNLTGSSEEDDGKKKPGQIKKGHHTLLAGADFFRGNQENTSNKRGGAATYQARLDHNESGVNENHLSIIGEARRFRDEQREKRKSKNNSASRENKSSSSKPKKLTERSTPRSKRKNSFEEVQLPTEAQLVSMAFGGNK